jgi:hypothetical protein
MDTQTSEWGRAPAQLAIVLTFIPRSTNMAAESTPIAFSALNGAGAPAIYLTNDPTVNTLTLKLRNSSGAPIELAGGMPVSEDRIAPGGPSSLYLIFGGLLTNEEVENLDIAAEGWNVVCFNGARATWACTPVADRQFGNDEVVTFTITNILASGQPHPGQLTIDYYNLGGISDDSAQIALRVENAPAGNKQLDLNVGFRDSPTVYVTSDEANVIANAVTFYLTNPSATDPILNIPAGKPLFMLSFVAGVPPGYGAFATVDEITNFVVGHGTIYADVWDITKNDQGEFPYWTLTPQGPEILGIADASTVEFTVSDIITRLEPGITPLYIQYANIPGYDDGGFALDLKKELGPVIVQFAADPKNTPPWADSIHTTLTWAAENADFVTFNQEVGGSVEYDTTGTLPLVVKCGQEITITAHLQVAGAGEITASRTITIRGLEQSIVESGLGAVGPVVIPPTGDMVYIVESVQSLEDGETATRIALMRRSDYSILETIDLNSALDPGLRDGNMIIGTYLAADGNTLYAMLVIGNTETITIIAVDTATNTPVVAAELSGRTRGAAMGSMVTSSDGTKLYAFYLYSVLTDSGVVGASALVGVDLVTRTPIYDYQWLVVDVDKAGVKLYLLAVSPDGKHILGGLMTALCWIDISEAVPVLSWMNVESMTGLLALSPFNPTITSDWKKIFMVLMNHINMQAGTANVMVMSFDLDLEARRVVPGAPVIIASNAGGPSAITTLSLGLSPDNGTLAMTFLPGQIVVVDTGTLEFHTGACGTADDFAPVYLAVDNDGVAVYATGYNRQLQTTVNAVAV